MPITEYFHRHNIQPDPAQQQVCESLSMLMKRASSQRAGGIGRLLSKRMKSAYVWGRPGRGKTMLMDALVATSGPQVRRVHYHNFLRDLHEGMNANIGKTDYLAMMANELADSCEVFCLDEFHLHDVADVILFERFLKVLLERQVFVVLTSNYPPDDLLPDPDVHHRALNCIAMIHQHFEVMTLNGERDYRYRNLGRAVEDWPEFYLAPVSLTADQAIANTLNCSLPDAPTAREIPLRNRTMPVRLCRPRADEYQSVESGANETEDISNNEGLVWLDFEATCAGPRSHLDYLQLVEAFDTLVLTGIFHKQLENPNTLRRFIWLVDVAYEYRRRLFISSEVPILELLENPAFEEDTSRLISRLVEMKSPGW